MHLVRRFREWFTPAIVYISITILAFLTACVETDIYVPAFPSMLEYFKTTEYKMELLLSLNFIGLCISGLIYGPLSDSFGRKRIVLVGLGIFMLSSFGCVVTDSIEMMIALRLFQGLGAGAVFGVMPASFFDIYEPEAAAKIIAYMTLVMSAAMACAPMLGTWVNEILGWRANFGVIAILATVTFLLVLTQMDETLPKEKRQPFSAKGPILNYIKLFSSYRYVANSLIMAFMTSSMLVYVSSLSLIFQNHLGVSVKAFSIHQAAVLFAFMAASFTLTRSVEKLGGERVRNLGAVCYLIGSAMLFIVALVFPRSPVLITISMVLATFGSCFAMVAFHTAAVTIFPEIKGAANAFTGSLRLAIIAFLIFLGGRMFNGTILPVALIIFASALLCIVLFLGIKLRQQIAGTKIVHTAR